MTTYAIGDLHGCLTPLQRLLDHIAFDPANDTLWFVGDLVNRGPESLEVLRFVRSLGETAISVLGNHDLHLLAVAHGIRRKSSKDTLQGILNAPDRDALLDWLAARPLLHVDEGLEHTLVHAGIHPAWSLPCAQRLSAELHVVLTHELPDFLTYMYGNTPARWSDELSPEKRRRFAINAFTRMRYCRPDGGLDFDFNGAPSHAPRSLRPWYAMPDRKPLPTTLVFGHWSSHPSVCRDGVIPTDRGCAWGGDLAAYAIETGSSHWVSGCR